MKRSRFTEEQIIGMLKEQEAGAATADTQADELPLIEPLDIALIRSAKSNNRLCDYMADAIRLT